MVGALVVGVLWDFAFQMDEAATLPDLFQIHRCWLLPWQLDMTRVPLSDISMHSFVLGCRRLPSCHKQSRSSDNYQTVTWPTYKLRQLWHFPLSNHWIKQPTAKQKNAYHSNLGVCKDTVSWTFKQRYVNKTATFWRLQLLCTQWLF